MDVTKFVLAGRDQALLYGDYSTYRASLSRRLLSARKRLGRTTKKGAKFTKKAPVTAEDIASNNEFIHLPLLAAERAWAHAMTMKASHAGDSNGITGPTRSHIVSRLRKATSLVDDLIVTLRDQSTTGATETDVLEARAYSASLAGAEEFEKQTWEACVKSYAECWVLYSALASTLKSDQVKELLVGTIEQSIRYAAYQMRMPRTVAVPAIARKFFPRTDPELVASVEKLDSSILRDSNKAKTGVAETDVGSKTITWRTRTVELEDADIATALSSVQAATNKLSAALSAISTSHPKDRAASYDDLLIASQDAVDATKHAIDELTAEGVTQGDKRMQSLQITRTAVSYDMISWRIGRNRVLTGEEDGTSTESSPVAKARKSKKAKVAAPEKEEGAGRQLARLREKVVMYDSTLQSLDSIKELPGIAADATFLKEIEAKHQYFRALKCLAIARSHSTLSEHKNALALLVRASGLLTQALPALSNASSMPADSPPNIDISESQARSLSTLLTAETQRLRALVELSGLSNSSQPGAGAGDIPLIERLNTYPSNGVNLKNLVSFPPKLEPIPVKPLFFDVAWNYIEYPGREHGSVETSAVQSGGAVVQEEKMEDAPVQQQQQQPAKKGWGLGLFGRS